MPGFTNNGCTVEMNADQLPEAYVKPVVTKIVGQEFSPTRTYTIAKSAVENANKIVTFDAIVTAIIAAATAEFEADYDTAVKQVDLHSELIAVATDQTIADGLYDNTAYNYLCEVRTFIKTT